MSTDNVNGAQLQNWNNFCKYHTGDWCGIWNRYFPNGEVSESFKCIRSFYTNVDDSEINHQNFYIYADGRTETQKFDPYKRPNTRSLFLDNSFSWGSTQVKQNCPFGFETGFRHEDRRASAAIVYANSRLEQIVIISEQLSSFAEKPFHIQAFKFNNSYKIIKQITPYWLVNSIVETSYKQLVTSKNYHVFNFPEGVSIRCPRHLENEKEFFLAVDWQVSNTLLLRGVRYFNASGFKNFTLEVFNCCTL